MKKRTGFCAGLLSLVLLLAACNAGISSLTASITSQAGAGPNGTLGTNVTPVPVEAGADTLSEEALLEIYGKLTEQAIEMASMGIFEVDMEDGFISGNETYRPILNFADREEIIHAYETVFSCFYFQQNIYPFLFLQKYSHSGAIDPLILEQDGKLHLNYSSFGIPLNGPIESDHEIIKREADCFWVKMRQGWLANGGHIIYQPYTVSIVNQNGLWVLENYYWFDVLLYT